MTALVSEDPKSLKEIATRGRAIYQQRLRATVEVPENIGKLVVLDVDSGDYEIAEEADEVDATDRLRSRHPEAVLYVLRVGFVALEAIGTALSRQSR